jgi:hypothetical protein
VSDELRTKLEAAGDLRAQVDLTHGALAHSRQKTTSLTQDFRPGITPEQSLTEAE